MSLGSACVLPRSPSTGGGDRDERAATWVAVARDGSSVIAVGHLLQIQRPAPVARGIADFLGRHPID